MNRKDRYYNIHDRIYSHESHEREIDDKYANSHEFQRGKLEFEQKWYFWPLKLLLSVFIIVEYALCLSMISVLIYGIWIGDIGYSFFGIFLAAIRRIFLNSFVRCIGMLGSILVNQRTSIRNADDY